MADDISQSPNSARASLSVLAVTDEDNNVLVPSPAVVANDAEEEEEQRQLPMNLDLTSQEATKPLGMSTAIRRGPVLVSSGSASAEGRRCWVCFEDDEDAEGVEKVWRRPCRCRGSIEWCHEECLLRYIQSRKDSLKQVTCPQCHTAYKIVEPNPMILRLLVMGDQSLQALMPYLTFMGISSTAMVMFTTYGAYALVTFASDESLLTTRWSWRTWVGLPLIPIVLIFSRTEFLDPLLPALPLLLLRDQNMDVKWPPSRGMLLSWLPWVRAIYNGVYGKLYARATGRRGRENFDRPRDHLLYQSGGAQHVFGPNNAPVAAAVAVTPGTSVSVSGEGNANTENGVRAATIAANRVMERVNSQANNGEAGNPRDARDAHVTSHFTTSVSTTDGSSTITTVSRTSTDSDIEDTEYETTILERRDLRRVVIGALFLPAISSTMGTLLTKIRFIKLHIPDIFHRNIIGGCLFILAKDLCLLSYTYLKRRQFELRRVRNYEN